MDKRNTSDSARLRLAVVTNRFHPEVGGAETNIYFQARELSRHADVTVFCPRRIDRPARERVDDFTVVRLWDALNPMGKVPNIKTKTFCPSIVPKIYFGGFDIVQFFPALSWNNTLAYHAAKLSGKPVVGCFFDFIDYAGVIQRQGGVPPGILDSTPVKSRDARLLRGLDHIFAISFKEIELLKRYNSNVEYSPVPIRLDEYTVPPPPLPLKSRHGVSDGEFVFLCLGRVSKIKGQDLAVDAFCRTFQPEDNVRLVIVGRHDYEPEFVAAMRARIEAAGMSARVVFTGMLDRPEVLWWLRRADIHAIPVRFMNSGAVVVESWISGTPVIQSDVVDPNLVEDGVNGYLFKTESVEGLASAMRKAVSERERFPAMVESGKRLVLEKYTYQYLVELYRKAYDRILSKSGL